MPGAEVPPPTLIRIARSVRKRSVPPSVAVSVISTGEDASSITSAGLAVSVISGKLDWPLLTLAGRELPEPAADAAVAAAAIGGSSTGAG